MNRRSTLGSRLCPALVATIFALPLGSAYATEQDFLDLLDQENRVFAASRYAQSLADTPASASVITRDDIARFGYRTLQEALLSLPGFYDAASQWPALGLRGSAIPGDFGSRLLFMVNGMPIYEPTYGGFFVEYVDIGSVERIEMIRGPGSALYGSGAVLGVINIITRTGQTQRGHRLSAETSSHGTHKVYGSVAEAGVEGREGFVSMSAARSNGRKVHLEEHRASDGAGDSTGNDQSDTARLFARLSNGEAWIQAIVVNHDRSDPLASYGTLFNTDKLRLQEDFGALETGLARTLENSAVFTGRAYLFKTAERGEYPYGANRSIDYINVSDLESTQYGLELRYDQFFQDSHRLLAGLEIKQVDTRHRVGDQPGSERAGVFSVDDRPRYLQLSGFVQEEIVLDMRRRLFLGARYDDYRSFSPGVRSRLSPRIAYVQHFDDANTGKILYGESYRVPTVYESLYQDGVPAASTLWRNTDLRPEIARTLEVVWERESFRGLNWGLGAFVTRLQHTPVQFVTPTVEGQDCVNGAQGCVQYRNSQFTFQTSGIQGHVKLRRADGVTGYGSFTFQRGKVLPTDEPLTSSPKWTAKAGMAHPLPWGRWGASLEAQFVTSVEGRQEGSRRTASAPSYLLVNASVSSPDIGDGWRLSLRADNLLDRRYYTIASRELQPLERVPADGRRLSLQISKGF